MLPVTSLSNAMLIAAALAVALMVDLCCGEPAARWHPVVWMGGALQWFGTRIAPPDSSASVQAFENPDWKAFMLGIVCWYALAAIIFIVTLGLQLVVLQWHPVLAAVLLGLLLKPMLAWRMLRDEVMAVELALTQSVQAGRARLSWLVSRDVQNLTEVQVRESAVESLAENLNDSVVSPILWFVMLGLPGAALYRLANTADAMWGYRGVRAGRVWEWAGKWAAKADDVLSWPGARMSACLVVLLVQTGVFKTAQPVAWRTALAQQARKTPSPNSGWPMAAFALALHVRLAKPGAYVLNDSAPPATPAHVHAAINLAGKVVIVFVLIAQAAIIFIACALLGRA